MALFRSCEARFLCGGSLPEAFAAIAEKLRSDFTTALNQIRLVVERDRDDFKVRHDAADDQFT